MLSPLAFLIPLSPNTLLEATLLHSIMPSIRRVTLFKIPNEDDQQKLLSMYKTMQSRATKVSLTLRFNTSLARFYIMTLIVGLKFQDGEPYILSVEAGTTQQDQRAQGYTIVATSTFKNEEDFHYYDKECKTHDELRTYVRTISQGFCMVYFALS